MFEPTLILSTSFTLGLPMVVAAWFLFDHLLETGDVEKDDLDKQVKALGKTYAEHDEQHSNPLIAKWMKFGGGFYGLAALYTFVVIEIIDIAGFIFNFPGWEALLSEGVIKLLINAFINQIMNFVEAMIWFTYWGASVPLNFLIAYIGYYIGQYIAREDIVRGWLHKSEQEDS